MALVGNPSELLKNITTLIFLESTRIEKLRLSLLDVVAIFRRPNKTTAKY